MLINILEFIKSISRPLIIFCQNIAEAPLSLLVYNKVKGGLNVTTLIIQCIAVTIPDYVDDKSNFEIFDDISTVTGSKLCGMKDLYEFSPEEIFGKNNLTKVYAKE